MVARHHSDQLVEIKTRSSLGESNWPFLPPCGHDLDGPRYGVLGLDPSGDFCYALAGFLRWG